MGITTAAISIVPILIQVAIMINVLVVHPVLAPLNQNQLSIVRKYAKRIS
jgi:hypothetical protein